MSREFSTARWRCRLDLYDAIASTHIVQLYLHGGQADHRIFRPDDEEPAIHLSQSLPVRPGIHTS